MTPADVYAQRDRLARWAWLAAAAAGVLAAVLIRAALLDQRQLFKDEGASWLLSTFTLPELIAHTARDTYPPLHALLLHLWMDAFGNSITTMRALSVLLGLGVVAAAWRWGHEALGRNWGLVVLMAVGLSGLAMEEAREVRLHVLEVFCATAAWWLTWRLARGEAQRHSLLVMLVLAAAVAGELWASPMGIPTAGLQGALALAALAIRGSTGGRAALLGIVLGCVTFLPWLSIQLGVAFNGQAFWSPVPSPLLLPYAFDAQLMGRGHTRFAATLAGLPLLAVAAVGVLDLVRGRAGAIAETKGDRFLGWTLTFALALIPLAWLYSQVRSVWDVDYFGSTIAPLGIALAAGGRALARRLPKYRTQVLVALCVLVFSVQGLSSMERLQQRLADEDLTPARQVYQQLAGMVRSDDLVLALDSRSYFAIDYLVGRRVDPLPLAAPLYAWDSGAEPFFVGQGLVPSDRLIDQAWVNRFGGWTGAFPGLRSGGRVFLIDLEDDDQETIGFGPLDEGRLEQVARQDIAYAGRIAQIRTLVAP